MVVVEQQNSDHLAPLKKQDEEYDEVDNALGRCPMKTDL